MGLLTPELRAAVGQTYMKNFLQAVSRPDALRGTHIIDPDLLLEGLTKNKTIFDTFMAPGLSGELRSLSQQIATKDLKILAPEDVSRLSPSAMRDALAARLARQMEYDEFLKTNPLAMLRNKADSEVWDTAAKWATTPGSTARTQQVADTLGPEAFKDLQKYSWSQLFKGTLKTDVHGNVEIDSAALRSNISKYSKEQRELLWPNGQADDILKLVYEN
jgi:hypothetical protein